MKAGLVPATQCTCHFIHNGQRTTCNAEEKYLLQFEDRLVDAINLQAELATAWTDIVARGQEYLARYSNLILETEQLDSATFATMASTRVITTNPSGDVLAGDGDVNPVVDDSTAAALATAVECVRSLSAGKREHMLVGIQHSLLALHDRLGSLQQRRAASVRQLASDVDCSNALALQECSKTGVLTADGPVFKTLGIADFHSMLARISDMYEQELVLKYVFAWSFAVVVFV